MKRPVDDNTVITLILFAFYKVDRLQPVHIKPVSHCMAFNDTGEFAVISLRLSANLHCRSSKSSAALRVGECKPCRMEITDGYILNGRLLCNFGPLLLQFKAEYNSCVRFALPPSSVLLGQCCRARSGPQCSHLTGLSGSRCMPRE